MRRQIHLTATIGPDGTAEANAPGPQMPWHTWTLIRATSTTDEIHGSAELRLYVGAPSPASFVDGTEWARQDVSEFAPGPVLAAGESIVAQWAGGTPGATGTVTITIEETS